MRVVGRRRDKELIRCVDAGRGSRGSRCSVRALAGCGPSLAVLLSREVEGGKGARSRASSRQGAGPLRGCRSWESSECPRPPGSCWTQPPWALRPVFSAGPRPLSRTGIPGCVLSQCWGTGRGRRWRFWGIVEAWRVFGALAAAPSPEGPRHRGGPLARTFQNLSTILSAKVLRTLCLRNRGETAH